MRDFCEQSYVKLDNLEKMENFLKKYNLPRLDHYKTENVKKQIIVGDWINNKWPPNKQISRMRCLYWWILPHIQKGINIILQKVFEN